MSEQKQKLVKIGKKIQTKTYLGSEIKCHKSTYHFGYRYNY